MTPGGSESISEASGQHSWPVHPAALPVHDLLAQCTVRFDRRSGPGGQNRNKVETAAILVHVPTGIVAEANERRTQGQNREAALHRLRLRLALDVRLPPAETPSPLWQSRCRGGRMVVSPDHDDFPALLAEALDILAAAGDDPKIAASRLDISTTQYVNLLRAEPRALVALNERRAARGERSLH